MGHSKGYFATKGIGLRADSYWFLRLLKEYCQVKGIKAILAYQQTEDNLELVAKLLSDPCVSDKIVGNYPLKACNREYCTAVGGGI